MQARLMGWEDPLEKGMATHSSILAWRISWTEEPSKLQSLGSQSQIRQKPLSMRTCIAISRKRAPLYVRGEYVIETYVCGVRLLTIQKLINKQTKLINRPSPWKGKFALFQMPVTTRGGVADICPKADSPALTTSEGKSFYIQNCVGWGAGGENYMQKQRSHL